MLMQKQKMLSTAKCRRNVSLFSLQWSVTLEIYKWHTSNILFLNLRDQIFYYLCLLIVFLNETAFFWHVDQNKGLIFTHFVVNCYYKIWEEKCDKLFEYWGWWHSLDISAGLSSTVEGLVWVFSSDNEFRSFWLKLCWIHHVCIWHRKCQSVSWAGPSPGFGNGWCVCGPSLLYLGWSSARVNYWRAPVPCVTGDRQGGQNIVMPACPILKGI